MNILSHDIIQSCDASWQRPADMQRLYGGKEWLGADGRDEYNFHARRHAPTSDASAKYIVTVK